MSTALLKKFFSHSAIYGLSGQISKVAGILVLPIITPYLTREDYGTMGIIMAYTGFVLILQNIGLNVIAANSFYQHPSRYKWVWRQLMGFLNLWYIPFHVLLGALLYVVLPDAALEHRWEIIWLTVIPGILFGPSLFLGLLYFQLNQRPKSIAIRGIVFGFLTVALNVITIVCFEMGFMGWIYTTAFVTILNKLSYWIPLRFKVGIKPIYAVRWRLWKKRLSIAIPLMPHYYSSFLLNSSDQMVMERLELPTDLIGAYNFPARFGGYFGVLAGAFNQAITPFLLQSYKENNEAKAKFLVYNFQLALFGSTFTFCLWSKEIFQILVNNPSLESTYWLVIPIVMGYNYRGMYVGANSRLFFYERTKVLWKITFLAGVSNVVLNVIFIPIYGIVVAAITTFVSLMYMGYAGFYLKDYKELTGEDYHPMKWLFATILLTVIAFLGVDVSLYLKIFIFIFTLSGIAWFFNYFKKNIKTDTENV